MAIEKIKFLEKIGFKAIVLDSQSNHNQGHALDQIWTNLEFALPKLKTVGGTFDHDIILADLILKHDGTVKKSQNKKRITHLQTRLKTVPLKEWKKWLVKGLQMILPILKSHS